MPERKDVLEIAIDLLRDSNPLLQGDEYNDAIVIDLEKRAKVGSAKYGTPLQTNNGRNALLDLYEEMLDAYMYAVQFAEETGSVQKSVSIASTVMLCLQSVAREAVVRNGITGLLSHPNAIEPDNRNQIEQYANYKDAYRSFPPQQYQED